MKASISIEDKKEFVRWLLNKHQMKIRESMWILNYIAGHDQIMKYVHFVDNAEGCPRGLVLTALGVDDEPFRFFKGNIVTTDPEKAFHDIRLNWDEDIYIQLHFPESLTSPRYAFVREDNPFEELLISDKEKEIASQFLDTVVEHFSKEKLLLEIDAALDAHDEERFQSLMEQFKQYN
ncbi:ReoY family proteolytic degradation factor [Listeria rocourtiae]|uniref:ReoY family proteolytic degradation factor n=1 Tax=Listeria rocourtiae TaxID=647910 RepID=UPI003D2F6E86